MSKTLFSTTALAAILALGLSGPVAAQGQAGGTGAGQPMQMQTPGAQMGGQGTATPMAQPGAVQGGGQMQQQAMSEEQLRSALRGRGYTDLSGIERDGEYFKVSEAKRYGEEVKDLRVNAHTGEVRDEPRLTEDQAKRMLEQRGYSNISDVERDDNVIRAKAKQGDREVSLRIDARTGMVTQQQAAN